MGALDIQMDCAETHDPAVVNTLSHLAGLYEGMIGIDSRSATTVTNLGALYAAHGKVDEAEKFFLHALEILESTLRPTDTRVIEVIEKLIELYDEHERAEDAAKLRRRVEVIERYLKQETFVPTA